MNFNTIVIIFIVLAILVIGFSIWKSTSVDDKKVNPDVPLQCFGSNCKYECGVTDPITIKRCKDTEDGRKICASCKCDSSGKLSGCMECREADPSDPKKSISLSNITLEDQCTDPFFWDAKNKICTLSKGFYCLPHTPEDIDCNEFTGRKLLALDTETNEYNWVCQCKDDKDFTGITCSNINICGLEGSSINPDNSNGGRGLIRKGTTDDYWISGKSQWDPTISDNTSCVCRPNEIADNTKKLCLPNNCSPGTLDLSDPSSLSCNCNNSSGQRIPGLIDCNMISQSYQSDGLSYYNGVCKRPSCVPDPCGGPDGKAGYYDYVKDSNGNVISGQCVCNTGYHLVPDTSAYGGFVCKELCVNNGPCGNRGTCAVNDLNKVYTMFTISCKSQDDNGQCQSPDFFIIYQDGSTNKYLNYYSSDNSLKIEDTHNPNSFFKFKLRMCNTKNDQNECIYTFDDVKSGLNSGSYYYLMIGDKYLIFNNNNTYNLVSDDNPEKEKSLFLFTSIDGNKKPKANVKGTIFLDKANRYLSLDKKTFKISYDYDIKTQEYCYNCNPGWRQDPKDISQQCIDRCQLPGYIFKRLHNPGWFGDDIGPYTQDEIKNICCSGLASQDSDETESGIWYYGKCL
jgi:hypothetical protein